MGPPTGWHRLRLLREILDELVPGVEQFLLVNNVVAVEDGAALVPGQEHGDPLGDAGADQVARGGAAAVVKEAGRHPSGLAGGAPRRAPAADGDAVAVEDRCFRHQLLLPRPYLVLTKPLRLDIQCQRGASVKIGWKYLDD